MKTKKFTLVEIMIVVAIIGILAAIAIPNLAKSRDRSQANACIANLKQIEGAVQSYLAFTNTAAAPTMSALVTSGDLKAAYKCPAKSTDYKIEAPGDTAANPVWVTCESKIDTHVQK